MKTLADLQDDVANHGPWQMRLLPVRSQRYIIRSVLSRWTSVSNKHKRQSAIADITKDCRRQISFFWSFIIGMAVRALVYWLLDKCSNSYEYQYVVKQVRKLQGIS